MKSIKLIILVIFFIGVFECKVLRKKTQHTLKHHHQLHSKSTVGLDGFCDKKDKSKQCDKGLFCKPIARPWGIHITVEWLCKPKDFSVQDGDMCIYLSSGSQCVRNSNSYSTCKNTVKTVDGFQIGTCIKKSPNKKLLERQSSLPDDAEPKANIPETARPLNLDEDEQEEVQDALSALKSKLGYNDDFAAGYLILTYFVDEDQIDNAEVKKLLEDNLYSTRVKRSCEEVEESLNLINGIHVVSSWSTAQRNKDLWLQNNGYLKGIKDIGSKVFSIKALADESSKAGAKILGEFASNAEIAGGFIKSMVDLAINTIVDRQLTRIMLAAISDPKSSGESSDLAQKIYRMDKDHFEFKDGYGLISTGGICREIKVNTGLKYLTKVVKKDA